MNYGMKKYQKLHAVVLLEPVNTEQDSDLDMERQKESCCDSERTGKY